jgi:hypothetical protein
MTPSKVWAGAAATEEGGGGGAIASRRGVAGRGSGAISGSTSLCLVGALATGSFGGMARKDMIGNAGGFGACPKVMGAVLTATGLSSVRTALAIMFTAIGFAACRTVLIAVFMEGALELGADGTCGKADAIPAIVGGE